MRGYVVGGWKKKRKIKKRRERKRRKWEGKSRKWEKVTKGRGRRGIGG